MHVGPARGCRARCSPHPSADGESPFLTPTLTNSRAPATLALTCGYAENPSTWRRLVGGWPSHRRVGIRPTATSRQRDPPAVRMCGFQGEPRSSPGVGVASSSTPGKGHSSGWKVAHNARNRTPVHARAGAPASSPCIRSDRQESAPDGSDHGCLGEPPPDPSRGRTVWVTASGNPRG